MIALPEGRHFGDDQPEIVKVLENAGSYKTIRYVIRRPCCGTFLSITHKRLIELIGKPRTQCRRCYEASDKPKRIRDWTKVARTDEPIVPPSWPVPRSVMKMKPWEMLR